MMICSCVSESTGVQDAAKLFAPIPPALLFRSAVFPLPLSVSLSASLIAQFWNALIGSVYLEGHIGNRKWPISVFNVSAPVCAKKKSLALRTSYILILIHVSFLRQSIIEDVMSECASSRGFVSGGQRTSRQSYVIRTRRHDEQRWPFQGKIYQARLVFGSFIPVLLELIPHMSNKSFYQWIWSRSTYWVWCEKSRSIYTISVMLKQKIGSEFEWTWMQPFVFSTI